MPGIILHTGRGKATVPRRWLCHLFGTVFAAASGAACGLTAPCTWANAISSGCKIVKRRVLNLQNTPFVRLDLLVCSIEEGHDLGSVAAGGGAEVGGIDAVGDAVFHGPQDGLIEEVGALHIHEGILGGGGLRASLGPPQEGDHRGAVTGVEGAEGGGGGAVRDLLL